MIWKKYDVIIVGGGVAGALLAYKLSTISKLSILILEAGADRKSERIEMSLGYAFSKNKSPGSPYNKSKIKVVLNIKVVKCRKNCF